jgi:hypothetical protein
MMEVLKIDSLMIKDWLLRIHYAKRIPSISYAFGLYIDKELCGIVTYGTPSSAPLKSGIAGVKNQSIVLELNRLVFKKEIKNGASYLISKSLKYLPKPTIVVSYADTGQGHIGYVYQACNFIYTGLSAKRTDWKIRGKENLHGQTIADMSRGVEGSRVKFMKDKFGDDFYLKDRDRKHRYIYIVANKYDRPKIRNEILYKEEKYPKGDTKKYEINYEPNCQILLL